MLQIVEIMGNTLPYILHYGLFIFAVLFFTCQVRRRLKEVKKGKPEKRTDQIGKRIKAFLVNVIGQKRLFRDFGPGLAHAFIFWGFIILAIGYAIFYLTAREVHESSFLMGLLGHGIINIYVILQDTFAFLVMLGLLYGFFNHFIRRYKRLENNFDAAFVLFLILFIILSFFMTSALRIGPLTEGPEIEKTATFTAILAGWLENMPVKTAELLYLITFWFHSIIILGFLVYLPSSKHMHLFISEPNVFLLNLEERGKMRMMDLEADENFGANNSEDLTWRSLLDAYACVQCGRCTDACPANSTDKPLNPKLIINKLREYMDDRRTSSEDDQPEGIIGKYTTQDEIWSCTTCYACQQECPILIEHLDKIYEYRRNLVLMESSMPSEWNPFFKNLETRANPGLSQGMRERIGRRTYRLRNFHRKIKKRIISSLSVAPHHLMTGTKK